MNSYNLYKKMLDQGSFPITNNHKAIRKVSAKFVATFYISAKWKPHFRPTFLIRIKILGISTLLSSDQESRTLKKWIIGIYFTGYFTFYEEFFQLHRGKIIFPISCHCFSRWIIHCENFYLLWRGEKSQKNRICVK